MWKRNPMEKTNEQSLKPWKWNIQTNEQINVLWSYPDRKDQVKDSTTGLGQDY